MIAKNAFSILEVLLATVLLATVVAVCTPYLQLRVVPTPEVNRDRLRMQVREQIAKEQMTHRAGIGYQDYAELAQLNGWGCEQVHHVSLMKGGQGIEGAWVQLSDGRAGSVHWVAPSEGVTP